MIPTTPGLKTTEFAFLVLFAVLNVLAVLAGMLDAQWSAVALAAVGIAYQIARGLAKANGVPDSSVPPPPPGAPR